MVEVSLAQLEADFPGLLETARSGEDVVIVSNGEPVARLDPLAKAETANAWQPAGNDFADRARQIRERFGLCSTPMSEAEVQAEWDELRGQN